MLPAAQEEDVDEAPGFWLRSGPALAFVLFWGVKQKMNHHSFSAFQVDEYK